MYFNYLCGHTHRGMYHYCSYRPEKPYEGWIRDDPHICPRWEELEQAPELENVCKRPRCKEAYERVMGPEGYLIWRKKKTEEEKRAELEAILDRVRESDMARKGKGVERVKGKGK
jgi:hypothetical protein